MPRTWSQTLIASAFTSTAATAWFPKHSVTISLMHAITLSLLLTESASLCCLIWTWLLVVRGVSKTWFTSLLSFISLRSICSIYWSPSFRDAFMRVFSLSLFLIALSSHTRPIWLLDFDIYNIYDDCGDDEFSNKRMLELLANRTVVVRDTAHSLRAHPALSLGRLRDYKVQWRIMSSTWRIRLLFLFIFLLIRCYRCYHRPHHLSLSLSAPCMLCSVVGRLQWKSILQIQVSCALCMWSRASVAWPTTRLLVISVLFTFLLSRNIVRSSTGKKIMKPRLMWEGEDGSKWKLFFCCCLKIHQFCVPAPLQPPEWLPNYNANLVVISSFLQFGLILHSGDVDGCVPYYGSEEWTRELGLTVKSPWR